MTEVQDNNNSEAAAGDLDLAEQLLAQAGSTGRTLAGPGGLLSELTQRVLERALDTEMTDHLGYEHRDYVGHHESSTIEWRPRLARDATWSYSTRSPGQ